MQKKNNTTLYVILAIVAVVAILFFTGVLGGNDEVENVDGTEIDVQVDDSVDTSELEIEEPEVEVDTSDLEVE